MTVYFGESQYEWTNIGIAGGVERGEYYTVLTLA